MTATNFRQPFIQFLDEDGKPLSGGRVTFYEAGFAGLKYVFTDEDRAVGHRATNPMILGIDGYTPTPVFMGIGNYAITLEKSDGAGGFLAYKDIDPYITGEIDTTVYEEMFIVNTITDLLGVDHTAHPSVKVLGYYAAGDGGGGDFLWSASETTAGDNGVYFGSGGSGRWVRTIVNAIVTAPHYGVFTVAQGYTDSASSRIGNAVTFVQNNPNIKLFIPSGDYNIAAGITFSGDITVELGSDAKFIGTSACVVTVSCHAIRQGLEPIVDGVNAKLTWTSGDANLEWFGTHEQYGVTPTDFSAQTEWAIEHVNGGSVLYVNRAFDMGLFLNDWNGVKLVFRNSGKFLAIDTVTLFDVSSTCINPCLALPVDSELTFTSFNHKGGVVIPISMYGATLTQQELDYIQKSVSYWQSNSIGKLCIDVDTNINGPANHTFTEYYNNVVVSFANGATINAEAEGTKLGFIDVADNLRIFDFDTFPVQITNKRASYDWWVAGYTSPNALLYTAVYSGIDESLIEIYGNRNKQYRLSEIVDPPVAGIHLTNINLYSTLDVGIRSSATQASVIYDGCNFENGSTSSVIYTVVAQSGRISNCTFKGIQITKTSIGSDDSVFVWQNNKFVTTELYMYNNSRNTWIGNTWSYPTGYNMVGSSLPVSGISFQGSDAYDIWLDKSNLFINQYTDGTNYAKCRIIESGTAVAGGKAYVDPQVSGSYSILNDTTYPLKRTMATIQWVTSASADYNSLADVGTHRRVRFNKPAIMLFGGTRARLPRIEESTTSALASSYTNFFKNVSDTSYFMEVDVTQLGALGALGIPAAYTYDFFVDIEA